MCVVSACMSALRSEARPVLASDASLVPKCSLTHATGQCPISPPFPPSLLPYSISPGKQCAAGSVVGVENSGVKDQRGRARSFRRAAPLT